MLEAVGGLQVPDCCEPAIATGAERRLQRPRAAGLPRRPAPGYFSLQKVQGDCAGHPVGPWRHLHSRGRRAAGDHVRAFNELRREPHAAGGGAGRHQHVALRGRCFASRSAHLSGHQPQCRRVSYHWDFGDGARREDRGALGGHTLPAAWGLPRAGERLQPGELLCSAGHGHCPRAGLQGSPKWMWPCPHRCSCGVPSAATWRPTWTCGTASPTRPSIAGRCTRRQLPAVWAPRPGGPARCGHEAGPSWWCRGSLPVGHYCFVFVVSFGDTPLARSIQANVTVAPSVHSAHRGGGSSHVCGQTLRTWCWTGASPTTPAWRIATRRPSASTGPVWPRLGVSHGGRAPCPPCSGSA